MLLCIRHTPKFNTFSREKHESKRMTIPNFKIFKLKWNIYLNAIIIFLELTFRNWFMLSNT